MPSWVGCWSAIGGSCAVGCQRQTKLNYCCITCKLLYWNNLFLFQNCCKSRIKHSNSLQIACLLVWLLIWLIECLITKLPSTPFYSGNSKLLSSFVKKSYHISWYCFYCQYYYYYYYYYCNAPNVSVAAAIYSTTTCTLPFVVVLILLNV